MLKFIFKRLLVAVPLLLGMSLMTFTLMQMTPGNFFDTMKLNPQVSPETIAYYKSKFFLTNLSWSNIFTG